MALTPKRQTSTSPREPARQRDLVWPLMKSARIWIHARAPRCKEAQPERNQLSKPRRTSCDYCLSGRTLSFTACSVASIAASAASSAEAAARSAAAGDAEPRLSRKASGASLLAFPPTPNKVEITTSTPLFGSADAADSVAAPALAAPRPPVVWIAAAPRAVLALIESALRGPSRNPSTAPPFAEALTSCGVPPDAAVTPAFMLEVAALEPATAAAALAARHTV